RRWPLAVGRSHSGEGSAYLKGAWHFLLSFCRFTARINLRFGSPDSNKQVVVSDARLLCLSQVGKLAASRWPLAVGRSHSEEGRPDRKRVGHGARASCRSAARVNLQLGS